MKVHTAQLAGGPVNADRVFCTHNAVIVLDGATAFEPNAVDPARYADTLGRAIADQLDTLSRISLADAVEAAISATADQLQLTPGRSPSSTVAVLRVLEDVANFYVLGDSPIHYGDEHTATAVTDDRLAAVATSERTHYVTRLRAGHGFDAQHRSALVRLQRAQRAARNKHGGYWIAEAEPAAAHHAVERAVPVDQIDWAVLATDGAADYIDHITLPWDVVARCDAEQLRAVLHDAAQWEADGDPAGQALPRAKQHDDKTLAAVPALW